MKSRVMSMLIVLAMVLSLSACEFAEETHVEKRSRNAMISFSWWGTDDRSRYTMESLQKFEKNNDVTVMTRYSELSGYKEMLDVSLNSDELCDVVQMNYHWLYEYGSKDIEFYDMYQLKDHIKLKNYTQEQLKLGEVNGKLMGIPVALNGINFFYNEGTLKRCGLEKPKTWEELFEMGRKLKSKGVYAVEMDKSALWLTCVAYTEQTLGLPLFDSGGRMQYTAEEFEVMLRFYKSLIDNNVTGRPNDFNHMDFYSGRTAGIACWISESKGYFSSNSGIDAASVDISLGDLPKAGKTGSGWYKRPTALYCIKKNTAEPKKAAQLVDYLLNSEEMAALQGTEKGVPLSRSALEVLESRDMMSDLQAVSDKKMNEDKSIKVMDPQMEQQDMIDSFFAAGDETAFNNADVYAMGVRVYRSAVEATAKK